MNTTDAQTATQYLDVPEGRIAYSLSGPEDGHLVVMAPGMGDVRAVYRFVVPQLVAAGYRVATMDLRGHGESSTGWDRHTTSAIGSDYVALIRHLGGPATVVGQSLSPDSAVTAAAELPDEITGVVAISPWAAAPQAGAFMEWLTGRVLRSPFLWGLFYSSLHKAGKPADFKAHVATLKSRLREPGRTEAFVAVGAPGAKDSAADRPRVHQPVLVLMGSKDPDFKDPRAEAESFASTLGGPSEIVMLAGAGHYPQAEVPQETAAALLAFLEKTVR
ncbi:Pimeloyl-ACP methyl ester carboxylesterase [Streptomyces indicus]|uniref:Pimeloyl-ACP methyl ester carboxylesterase n=2 Tax=Streptomyces indicus TaxID=417292 RepID=A0A1G9JHY1_9ACTN|nr:Pimeloyl-ACP methyl ester carboxylesterase [Streptomyces indicus]